MLFVELRFFFFFGLVFAIYWWLRRNEARKIWLLACSYAFYGAWDWRFLSLIIFSTLLDYSVGLGLGRASRPLARRAWLLAGLAGNLGLLGFFKYFNFFADSLADLAHVMGVPVGRTTLDIVLPVGISFYTFQTMSYSLDIYFGKLRPTRKLLDLALFVGFFPQLVAGPIVRARDFLWQLAAPRRLPAERARSHLTLFLAGFFKKACISDNLAPHVDRYFAEPVAFDAASAWIAILFYAVQIYCDFSGYSDMAIASAGLLGYSLCDNFAAPYFAVSITDFWRRWHMSLSSWLRDYLYIPLGGSHGSKLFRYRNLMITMLLGGLWHGASWNFVIWGGLHGLALIAHKEWIAVVPDRWRRPWAAGLLGMAATFYWVCLTWIFFRAGDLGQALHTARAYVLLEAPGAERLALGALWLVAALALVHWLAHRRVLETWWRRLPAPAFAVTYGVAMAVSLSLVPLGYRPFIYFQF